MKKIFYGISVTALSIILSTASMAADKVLTVASWAAPVSYSKWKFLSLDERTI